MSAEVPKEKWPMGAVKNIFGNFYTRDNYHVITIGNRLALFKNLSMIESVDLGTFSFNGTTQFDFQFTNYWFAWAYFQRMKIALKKKGETDE